MSTTSYCSRSRVLKIVATVFVLAAAEATAASDTGLIATINIPGNPLDNFDIGAVDQTAGRYYLADRSNAGIDIFDTTARTYIGRVTGFVGIKRRPDGSAANNMSGPNGLAIDTVRHELWVGDGDSTVKVIDIASVPAKLVATVSTGGQGRADELTVDEKDGIVAVGNNADRPTYVTLISTKPGHAIVSKIVMPDADDGIDQPTFVPETGLFYASVPVWKGVKNHGGLAVIDPKTAKFVKLIEIDDCQPAGSLHASGTLMLVGCSAGSAARMPGVPPATVIVDVKSERVVKVIHEVGGEDEVAFDPGAKRYYTGSRDQPGGPVLGVIDAGTNTWIENIPTGVNGHSVAAEARSHLVFVPLTAPHPACSSGCIGIYRTR